MTFPLCPGDTITIDYDLNRAANTHYSGAYHPEKRKALHIRGGMTPLLYVDSLKDALQEETVSFHKDSIARIHHLSYAEFANPCGNAIRIVSLAMPPYPSPEGEREFLQLASEKAYIDRCCSFPFINTLQPNPLDSVQMAAPEKQVDFCDLMRRK